MESKSIPEQKKWQEYKVKSLFVNNVDISGILDLRAQNIVPNAKVSIGTTQIGLYGGGTPIQNDVFLEMI